MEVLSGVDTVEITVLVDNMVLYGQPLIGEHGFSLYVQVATGNSRYRFIIDTGRTPETLAANMAKAKIPLEDIDQIFLTHTHPDHTGGLEWLLRERQTATKIVAHPLIFRQAIRMDGQVRRGGISLSKEEIEKIGGNLFLRNDAFELFPGVFSSGEIVRQTEFEGKHVAGRYIIEESGKLVEDLFLDDMAVVIKIRGKGLLILAGCSHAGIINTVQQAIEITGVNNICGIVGGLHLETAPDSVIAETLAALKKIAPAKVYAGHCTGFKAMRDISNQFGEAFTPLGSGMRMTF